MKKYLFLLLILGSLTVMGQEERSRYVQPQRFGEERPKFIQYLDLTGVKTLDIRMTGNYTTLCIYQDTVDYVAVRLNSWDDTNRTPNNIFTLNQTDALHNFHILNVYGFGTAGELEVHTSIRNLSILNAWYNLIIVSSPTDTLRFNSISATAQGNSTIQFLSPMVVENSVWLTAEDQGYVKYSSYECVDYSEMTRDQGSIVGHYRNGEEVSKLLVYNTVGRRILPGKTGWYNLSDRIHLNLYGAYNDCPVRIDKEYESAYSNRPSEFKGGIGSYQIELAYDIVARKHFTFGMGVGFNMDKYKFKDPYVRYISLMPIIDPEYGPIGVSGYYSVYVDDPPVCGGDSLQYWKSGLNVPFISFPVHFAYYANKDHKKGLHVGLDFIPRASIKGYAYQRYGQPIGESTFNGKPYEEFINMYGRDFIDPVVQIDIRLSVGWGAWSIFGQYSSGMASLLMFDYEYAYKVGLKLTL